MSEDSTKNKRAALAIRYRPLDFDSIVGQETVVTMMRAMVSKDYVPNSIVMSGTSGTGKTTSARVFSRALVCDHPDRTIRPCNSCDSCKEHLNNASYSYVEKDSAIAGNVSEIKKLRDEAYFKVGPYKVVVLDEFHLASRQSQSILLKFLEEAPAGIIFIFCTTDPDKILHTIHSRSFELTFRPISPKDVQSRLRFVADTEGISVEEKALGRLSLLSRGKMRNALNMLEQARISSTGEISSDLIETIFGMDADYSILEFLRAMHSETDVSSQFDALIKAVNIYQLPQEFFRVVTDVIRVLLGLPVNWDGPLMILYTQVSALYQDKIYKLASLLNTKVFTDFFSVESLYLYMLYIQFTVIGIKKETGTKIINPESNPEEFRRQYARKPKI